MWANYPRCVVTACKQLRFMGYGGPLLLHCLSLCLARKKKRKAPLRSVAKQPAPLPLALVSPVSVAMVTEPSSQETMGGDEVEAAEKEEVGGGEEGEEEELNEVLVADGKQNGTVTVEESGTETDSSESSVTD